MYEQCHRTPFLRFCSWCCSYSNIDESGLLSLAQISDKSFFGVPQNNPGGCGRARITTPFYNNTVSWNSQSYCMLCWRSIFQTIDSCSWFVEVVMSMRAHNERCGAERIISRGYLQVNILIEVGPLLSYLVRNCKNYPILRQANTVWAVNCGYSRKYWASELTRFPTAVCHHLYK